MTPEHEPSPHCLDAETLAAWVDRALPAADAAAAEAHVADCAPCQAVLAVLVKTLPAIAKPVPWWRRGWTVGALVPIAGGALALAVWIATPRSPQTPQAPQASASLQERAPTTPPAVASTPPPAAPTVAENIPRAEAPATLDRDKQKSAAPAPARATPASPADARNETAEATVDRLRRADATPAAPSAAAPATAPVASSAATAPAAEARQAAPARALGFALNKAAASVDIVSADPLVRWRIGAGGSIQHSADGGATWAGQPSGVTEDLIAGSAPQRDVCWVVGRAGTVLVSTNGSVWRRLEFPEAVDLTQVDARDGLVATVIAADGRRFQTADGGQSWSRLQDF